MTYRPTPERATLARGLAAACFVLPSALWALGRGGESWHLVLAAFVLPGLVGRRSDARVLATAIGLALCLPIVPVLARTFPFDLERSAVHGALAVLVWRGALVPRPAAAWVRWARLALLAWLVWSVGAALRGLWTNLPADVPWGGRVAWLVLSRWIATTPLVESTEPLRALFLRLDTVLVAWAVLETSLRDPRTPRVLAGTLAWAVPLALAAAVAEMMQGSHWRGESLVTRVRLEGLPRSHRPLADHNALGSAMLLVLPILCWSAWSAARVRSKSAVLHALALAAGVLLLFSSRSKSGFGGLALAVVASGALAAAFLPARIQRVLVGLAAAGMLAIAVLNVLPRPALEALMQTRRAEDVLRVFHYRGLAGYLRWNRGAISEAGARMGADAPVFGVGLGNFPRRLADYRDPDASYEFNPLHENAHNQYLQWWGEEGALGLALGLALFALGVAGGVRRLRAPPPAGAPAHERLALVPWTAALFGLFGNLAVGHALLVPTVAFLWAAWIGVLLSAGARPTEPDDVRARALPARSGVLLGALALLALVPLAVLERAPLDGFATGCHPWTLVEGQSVPDRGRVLEPDARWVQRWGAGTRMLLLVHDARPLRIPGEQRLSVALNDEWVLRDVPLERLVPPAPNPLATLKLDAPPGVKEGDLVEVRVLAREEFAGTLMYDKSRAHVGARLLPPVFLDPRGR